MTRSRMFFWCLSLFLWAGYPQVMAAGAEIPDNLGQQDEEKVRASGVVVDENGDPIPGANVLITGKSRGTVTDVNGKFAMPVPAGSTLQVSFIGYVTQQVQPGENLRIVLKEDSQMLEEAKVVEVGYGSQRMKNVTGAISTIDPKEIEDLPVGNLGAALAGRVTGLSVSGGTSRPGSQASLTIRNPFSVSKDGGTTDPLYVIDDFIADATQFNNLDPAEVESITVLKDAAAAVYGARASQGAVLVKTKKGKNGVPRISYSGMVAVNDEVMRPKVLNAYEYGLFYNKWNGESGRNKDATDVANFFQEDELEAMKSLNYDWLDKVWEPAFTMRHNINVSGGTERATYFGSVSYFTQDGNMGTLKYNRWNFRAGADVKVASRFKVGLQVSGDYGEKETTFNKVNGEKDEDDYNSLLLTPKYIPMYVDGLPVYRGSSVDQTSDKAQQYHYFELQKLGNTKHNMPTNLNINLSGEYEFKYIPGLKARGTYTKSITQNKSNQIGSKYKVYSFQDRTGSGAHLYEGATNAVEREVSNGNRLGREMTRTDNYQLNFLLTYNRTFGKHAVSGMFTIEKSENEAESVVLYKSSPILNNNGQTNTAIGDIETSSQTTRSEAGNLSYVGRANYAYADKYLLEFLFRVDASTKFAPENYWGFFPAVSAGWVVSEEDFFQNVSWMNFLKIRGSIGWLGKDNTKAWLWRQRYTYQMNKGGVFGTKGDMTFGLKMEAAPNRNAKWDNTTKYNLGLDMRFLDSRLGVTLDGYYDHNYNMLAQRDAAVPVTVGGNLAAENFDVIDSYGLELSLKWSDKIGDDFSYHVNLNTSISDSRYRKKDWPAVLNLWDVHPDGRTDTGKWGYHCEGMFRTQRDIDAYVAKYSQPGQEFQMLKKKASELKVGMLYYEDVRGPIQPDGTYAAPDGIVDENDQIRLSKHSNNIYGFTLNLGAKWKELSFSAQLGASWGGFTEISSSARTINDKQLVYTNVASFYKDMFDPELNPNGKWPNMYHQDINKVSSDFWQVSSFRMALRQLTLAYSLPKNVINWMGISACRFNFSAMNVLNFHNPYPDHFMDPNSSWGQYPNLRTFSFGLNLTL